MWRILPVETYSDKRVLIVCLDFCICFFLLVFQEMTLTENSRVLDGWINPPPPVYMQYYFFNVTNSEEVMMGAKPIVSQIGPYTYR